LADKVTGNLVGLWLLLPEHLRLGTWDLLRGWVGGPADGLAPRLALQLVHEAALCTTGRRYRRCLAQNGLELANGLGFLASDPEIHRLLNAHTIEQAQAVQIALGQIRHSRRHFPAQVLAVDPHRVLSYSKRQMRRRQADPRSAPVKMAQTFFALDADSSQPIALVTGTNARTVAAATPELLALVGRILPAGTVKPLVLADAEHFTAALLDDVRDQGRFDLLVPMSRQPSLLNKLTAIDPAQFQPRWAGFATTKLPYQLVHGRTGPMTMMVQRSGERPADYHFHSFLCTADRPELDSLTEQFPKRWHIEEFFNAHQALGWQRAGTQNLHIRYGQMTAALIAQAALHQLRQRLDIDAAGWDAAHFADQFLAGLEGDIRLHHNTIVVTYYNAPNAGRYRQHFEGLPAKLTAENIDPRIPWLYNYPLDFRFR
jgi:hypothetical protein